MRGARVLSANALVSMSVPAGPWRLSPSPKLSSAPPPNRDTRATIAFPESDRPDDREPAMPLPRPQSSRRHWRTAASARRCRSRAARGGRHPPRYCFFCGIGPRPPGRSNRLALTVRVIGLRGTRSCPAGIRTSPFALGPADLAVVLWRRRRRSDRTPSTPARTIGFAQTHKRHAVHRAPSGT